MDNKGFIMDKDEKIERLRFINSLMRIMALIITSPVWLLIGSIMFIVSVLKFIAKGVISLIEYGFTGKS